MELGQCGFNDPDRARAIGLAKRLSGTRPARRAAQEGVDRTKNRMVDL
jgi:hypothetical protein